jgi:hypothetical protein
MRFFVMITCEDTEIMIIAEITYEDIMVKIDFQRSILEINRQTYTCLKTKRYIFDDKLVEIRGAPSGWWVAGLVVHILTAHESICGCKPQKPILSFTTCYWIVILRYCMCMLVWPSICVRVHICACECEIACTVVWRDKFVRVCGCGTS